VDYDVISATAPNPDQIIELRLDTPEPAEGEGTQTPEEQISFELHDTLVFATGTISDHNGNPVPDGTMAEFFFRFGTDEISQREITQNGAARTTLFLDRSGTIEIRVESQPAYQSQIIRLDIPSEDNLQPIPTTEFITTEPPTETPTPTSTPDPEEIPIDGPQRFPNIGDWFLAVLVTGVFSSSIYLLTTQYTLIQWGFRSALLSTIGGLLSYIYLAVGLPGSKRLLEETGSWGVLGITITGVIIGWIVAWSWQRLSQWKDR
ncbi:MAG: hypothetical protein ACNA8H_06570, partial [Anaerolineales bacterium]